MDSLFAKQFEFVLPYLEDLIIFLKSKEEHLEHLQTALKILHEAGVALNRQKCQFLEEELIILGNKIKPEEYNQTLPKYKQYKPINSQGQ